jgi:hypothetical protein
MAWVLVVQTAVASAWAGTQDVPGMSKREQEAMVVKTGHDAAICDLHQNRCKSNQCNYWQEKVHSLTGTHASVNQANC